MTDEEIEKASDELIAKACSEFVERNRTMLTEFSCIGVKEGVIKKIYLQGIVDGSKIMRNLFAMEAGGK